MQLYTLFVAESGPQLWQILADGVTEIEATKLAHDPTRRYALYPHNPSQPIRGLMPVGGWHASEGTAPVSTINFERWVRGDMEIYK